MTSLKKAACGCWVQVTPRGTWIIDATSFLCRAGHVQGQAIKPEGGPDGSNED